MSYYEDADIDSGFGLRKAISRITSPASRIANFGKSGNQAAFRSASGTRELQEAQNNLKDRTAVRHDSLESWPLPGLAPMTRVRTNFGDVHAIALRKGDEVLVRSGEYKPIVWINRIMLDEHVLALKPDSNPIVIAPGALGNAAPSAEIMVSPRQIISADDKSGLTSPREASMLVSRAGVRRLNETSLSYTMLHVGADAEIYCEGLYLQFPLET